MSWLRPPYAARCEFFERNGLSRVAQAGHSCHCRGARLRPRCSLEVLGQRTSNRRDRHVPTHAGRPQLPEGFGRAAASAQRCRLVTATLWPRLLVQVGDPITARSDKGGGGPHHKEAPRRYPGVVRQPDRQRPHREHQQPSAGRQSQSARLPLAPQSRRHHLLDCAQN
jgi:hypothetical protein